MNRAEVEAINAERLARWANLLAGDHATAAVLIGVGHDYNAGSLSVCIPEEADGHRELISRKELPGMLRAAAEMIEAGAHSTEEP